MKSSKPKNNVLWISYDLGIYGDYDGMYTFLDKNGAVECGDSVARIIDFNHNIENELKSQLKEDVKNIESCRVYYVSYEKDSHKLRSGFIFGKRKVAPWKGFAEDLSEIEDLSNLFEGDD